MLTLNLFIDGEYWGPMLLEKPVSCATIADCYGVAEDNVVLIKSDEVKMDEHFCEMAESELSDWRELQDFIRNNDMSKLDNYEYVCSKMDVEDFAQYAAIEIYIGNAGWHINNNSACWRTLKKEKGNEYADGRWRFCLFDVNWSFEPDSEVYAQIDKEWDFYQMVKRLCKNEDFRKLYLGEINNMEQTFETSIVSLIIDEWSNVMEEPIRCHFKRFGIQNDADEVIEKEKKKIISYCINRPDEIDGFNEKLFE